MQTVSLCMIVRDEEDVLGRCLDTIADLVDEIIIVDTGSVDRTKEIAAQYTDQIYDFPWIDNFAAARNASFDKATMDYCLWLDADDILTEENRRKFKEFKDGLDGSADLIFLPYCGRTAASGRAEFVYHRERLLRRTAGFRWQGRVHEVIVPAGCIQYGTVMITHSPGQKTTSDSDRNLRIYQTMIAEGEQLDLREQYYYGRELYYHQQYADAVDVFSKFLQQEGGWVVNCIDACRLLAICYKQLGQNQKALQSLLWALSYEKPDAGICCDLGHYFLEQKRYEQSIYWYEQALQCEPQLNSGKFVQQTDYDYTPCLQLCVCYDHLGQWQKAEAYNEQAAQLIPDSKAVAYNRQYFQQRKQTINNVAELPAEKETEQTE